MIDLIVEMNKRGITIILVTHEQGPLQYADRVVRIEDGAILAVDS